MKLKLFLVGILLISAFFVYATANAQTWCHTFSANLGYAQSDSSDLATKLEVAYLHVALLVQGISYAPDGVFTYGEATTAAVTQFQAKYGISPQSGWTGPLTRTKLNQLYGCGGGDNSPDNPPNEPTTATCTSSNWSYSLYPSTCPSSGSQTKTWTKVGNCTGGVTHSTSETISCTYQPSASACTSFTYSDWSACLASGVKTRQVISSAPSGCTGGNPTTSQACTYVPSSTTCTESDWSYSLYPSTCPSSGSQTKTWTKVGNCTGGVTHSTTETVSCTPLPTVDLKANGSDGPLTISNNSSVALTWTSENATSCTASGGWTGSKGTSGSISTSLITSSQTYTITCTGPGGSVSKSVNVGVTNDLTVDLKINGSDGPVNVANNSSATLSWTSTNASSCTLSYVPCMPCGNSGPSPAVNVATSGSQQTPTLYYLRSTNNRDVPLVYTLTCQGRSDSVSINITNDNSAPTVTITANGAICPEFGCSQDIPIPVTGRILLSWQSTNATSCQAYGNWAGSKSLNGSQEVTTSPYGATNGVYTYYISCAGPGGTKLGSVKVGTYSDSYSGSGRNDYTIEIPDDSGDTGGSGSGDPGDSGSEGDTCRANCILTNGYYYAIGCDGTSVTKCTSSNGLYCQLSFSTEYTYTGGAIVENKVLTGSECSPNYSYDCTNSFVLSNQKQCSQGAFKYSSGGKSYYEYICDILLGNTSCGTSDFERECMDRKGFVSYGSYNSVTKCNSYKIIKAY